jgi:hypothetical protein
VLITGTLPVQVGGRPRGSAAPREREDPDVTGVEPDVQLGVARQEDRDVVRQLLELNSYEFSRFDGADVGPDGRSGYPYLDDYWSERFSVPT